MIIWTIIIGCVAIGWLILIWAFFAGAKKYNRKWDIDNHLAYERRCLEAKRRSVEGFAVMPKE